MNKFQSILGKVWKGFVAGGLASAAVVLTEHQFQVQSLADLDILARTVATAFLTGGVLALIKLWTWKP